MKGQAAIEYLTVFGIALVLSAPFIAEAQNSILGLSSSSGAIELQNSMDNLELSIETVVASGEPARRTFDFMVPENARSARIVNNSAIYYYRTSDGISTVIRTFEMNVTGELPEEEGRHRVTVYAENGEARVEVVN